MILYDEIFNKNEAEKALNLIFEKGVLSFEHFKDVMKRKMNHGSWVLLQNRFGLVAQEKEFLVSPNIFDYIIHTPHLSTTTASYKRVKPKKEYDWEIDFIVIAYDCEMDTVTQEVVLVSFSILNNFLEVMEPLSEFECLKDELSMYSRDFKKFVTLVKAAMCKFKTVYIVAHNGAKFDHFWLCDELQKIGVRFDFGGYEHTEDNDKHRIISNGSAYLTLNEDFDEAKLYFRDTYRYYPAALVKCGEFLNCPKLDSTKDESGVINFTKDNALDPQNILYCCRDTKIVIELLRWLREVFGAELVRYGLISDPSFFIHYSSQAEMAYAMALTHLERTPIYALDRLYTEEIRRAFYGARVDSMIYGQEFTDNDIRGIDIRSMYPASLNRPVRGGHIRLLSTEDKDDLESWAHIPTDNDHPRMAFVVLSKIAKSCYDKFFGILPLKVKKDSAMITVYVSEGRVCGWYTDIDIFNAQRDGWKLERVLAGLKWDYWVTDLSLFYRTAYENRKRHSNKNDPINALEKIKMNSSYGKFGQLQDKFEWFDDLDDEEDIGEYAVALSELNSSPNTAVSVCIDCLSWSRVQMCTLKHMCENRTVYYTDTDSLYLNKTDVDELREQYPHRFENSLSAGLEVNVDAETIYNCILVLGKKLYCCGDKNCENKPLVHAKGHKLSAVNYETMQRVLDGEYFESTRSSHADTFWYYMDETCREIRFSTGKWIKMSRRLQLSIPPYKYLCKECDRWHTSYIDNCGSVF